LKDIDTSRDDVSRVITLGRSTMDDFLRFKDTYYKTIGCKLALQNGEVNIYEVPSRPHGIAQSEIIRQLTTSAAVLNNEFYVSGPEDILIGDTCREPDITMIPRNRPRPNRKFGNRQGDAYPTLVVEIAVSNSVVYLDQLAAIYFDARTRIRLYLAIKLWYRRNDGTAVMVAMLYNRGSPNSLSPTIISFGTGNLHHATRGVINDTIRPTALTGVGEGGPPCNAPAIPQYQLQLPTVALYDRVPGGVPAGYPPNIDIDLYLVQQIVLQFL